MRRAHHLQPLFGIHLVRADDRANLIVEDLRRGPRQRAEAGFLEPRQEVAQRQAKRRRTLRHLQRREGMYVHIRQHRLDRAADAEIGLAGVVGMNAALQAHLGGAAIPCLLRSPHHFVQRQIVGCAAQFLVRLAFGERAETAAVVADVGVVDVAVDHVAHDVAADRLTQRIGRGDDVLVVGIPRREQADDLGFVQALAGHCLRDDPFDGAVGALQHRRARLWQHGEAGRPIVLARPAVRIDRATDTRGDAGRAPAIRREGVRRIDRQTLHQHLAHRGGALRRALRSAATAPRGSRGPASPATHRPSHRCRR